MPKRWNDPSGQPIVATVPRAAELFGTDPATIGRIIREHHLPVWGLNNAGKRVYRLRELAQLLDRQRTEATEGSSANDREQRAGTG